MLSALAAQVQSPPINRGCFLIMLGCFSVPPVFARLCLVFGPLALQVLEMHQRGLPRRPRPVSVEHVASFVVVCRRLSSFVWFLLWL